MHYRTGIGNITINGPLDDLAPISSHCISDLSYSCDSFSKRVNSKKKNIIEFSFGCQTPPRGRKQVNRLRLCSFGRGQMFRVNRSQTLNEKCVQHLYLNKLKLFEKKRRSRKYTISRKWNFSYKDQSLEKEVNFSK